MCVVSQKENPDVFCELCYLVVKLFLKVESALSWKADLVQFIHNGVVDILDDVRFENLRPISFRMGSLNEFFRPV